MVRVELSVAEAESVDLALDILRKNGDWEVARVVLAIHDKIHAAIQASKENAGAGGNREE